MIVCALAGCDRLVYAKDSVYCTEHAIRVRKQIPPTIAPEGTWQHDSEILEMLLGHNEQGKTALRGLVFRIVTLEKESNGKRDKQE